MLMVKISKTAAKVYKEICKNQDINPNDHYMRLFIRSNVAALSIEKDKLKDDVLYKSQGVKILVDKLSNTWLSTATIDYKGDDVITGFTVETPDLPIAGSFDCGSCTGDAGCC